jgi:hypothetical protein
VSGGSIIGLDEQKVVMVMTYWSKILRAEQSAFAPGSRQQMAVQLHQQIALAVMSRDILRRIDPPEHIRRSVEDFADKLYHRIAAAIPIGGDQPRIVTPEQSGIVRAPRDLELVTPAEAKAAESEATPEAPAAESPGPGGGGPAQGPDEGNSEGGSGSP